MSTKALFWAMEQNIPPGPKLVLIMIADWYHKQHGYAWPKHVELAEKTGFSVASVKRHIEWLITHGLVKKEKQLIGGRQHSNRYYLPINVLAFQVAQNELPSQPNMSYRVAQNELPSNTLTNTPTDTPNCADAQEADLKLSDMNLTGKKTKGEIFSAAKRDSQGKITPAGCAYIWRHSRASAADDNGFQIELSAKAQKQLKQIAIRVGSDEAFADIVWNVMSDWAGFTTHAEATSTAFKSPKDPNIDYFVKFIDAAADFSVEEDFGEGYKKPVKSISQKPLTNEPQKKDNAEKPISAEELLAISKELGK